MTPDRLLADSYSYLREHGQWPLVRTIQADYGPRINVRALAAEAGREFIICQEGADGRCLIMLAALARMPEAQDDLERLAAAVAYLGKCFEAEGSAPVSISQIAKALGLQSNESKRLPALLFLTSRLWSAASGQFDSPDFTVTPTEQAFFFRDCTSFADFETARVALEREDRRIGEILSEEYRRARGEPPSSPMLDQPPDRYKLSDPSLDALLQRDLAELMNVQGIGAWKATAVLAGSCLETLLFDVCKRQEEECVAKWGAKWPKHVTASELAKFAVTQRWITEDLGKLSVVLRRWRNIIHPHTALMERAPSKELADALTAILKLLVADLAEAEAA